MNRKKKKPLGNSAEHSGGTATLGTNLNPNLYALNYCLVCQECKTRRSTCGHLVWSSSTPQVACGQFVVVSAALLLPEWLSSGYWCRPHWNHGEHFCKLILQYNAASFCSRWASLTCSNKSICPWALMWQFMQAAVPVCTWALCAALMPSSHCPHMQITPRNIKDLING